MSRTRATFLDAYGAGVDHGPHVSLMDCGAAVQAAGIEAPPLTGPLRSWREFDEEVKERVYRTALYAVRLACPDAPAVLPAEPPERDYAFESKRAREERDAPEQATLSDATAD